MYEYECGNWIYDPSHTLYIRFINWWLFVRNTSEYGSSSTIFNLFHPNIFSWYPYVHTPCVLAYPNDVRMRNWSKLYVIFPTTFFSKNSFGYASTQGVCSYGYQLNTLGWNKLKIIEEDPYSEVFQTNNHQLMNLMYTVARVWLGSYVQFPHSYSYND